MIPPDLEFLAEDELIQIVPRFKMEPIQLLPYSVGPFYPNVPVAVPLWVASYLKKQRKCRILPPDWLTLDTLKKCKEAEDTNAGCTPPPHRKYAEIATFMLQYAPDDIEHPESIRTVVRDLLDIRVGKLVASVSGFMDSGALVAGVTKLTTMELATLSTLLLKTLDQLTVLRRSTPKPTESLRINRVHIPTSLRH
ncbi:hypothetical protein P879_02594 [Paragonimus westermani]|uniref:DNA replication complex GINS protein PSF2 n=1 Tax=Paragonimus westermani TaxID=34504 RepID=A0A8T0DX53_9TREM|nr:hypothetical protein P879_02594 [Paragonimus westermani]